MGSLSVAFPLESTPLIRRRRWKILAETELIQTAKMNSWHGSEGDPRHRVQTCVCMAWRWVCCLTYDKLDKRCRLLLGGTHTLCVLVQHIQCCRTPFKFRSQDLSPVGFCFNLCWPPCKEKHSSKMKIPKVKTGWKWLLQKQASSFYNEIILIWKKPTGYSLD